MKLRGIHLSPYFARAYMVLEAKGAEDEVEMAGMPGGFGSSELLAENPTGKIPYFLLDDGTCIAEGQMIAEYFDAIFDGPALIPSDPLAAVKVRLVGRIVDMYIAPHSSIMSRHFFRGTEPDTEAINNAVNTGLPMAFNFIESTLSGGEFAIGDTLTLADIALTPHMYFFFNLLSVYNIDLFGGRPKFEGWWQAHKNTALTVNCHERIDNSMKELLSSLK